MVRELADLGVTYAKRSSNLDIELSYIGDGIFIIPENELINRILEKGGKSKNDVEEVIELKRILQSCVDDGLIDTHDNQSYEGKINNTDLPTHEETSIRCIQVNYNKGVEIMDNWYYWLKYFPSVFPEPAHVAFSVITTLITAIITTLITIALVAN